MYFNKDRHVRIVLFKFVHQTLNNVLHKEYQVDRESKSFNVSF